MTLAGAFKELDEAAAFMSRAASEDSAAIFKAFGHEKAQGHKANLADSGL